MFGVLWVQHILYRSIHSANLDKSLKKWDLASYSREAGEPTPAPYSSRAASQRSSRLSCVIRLSKKFRSESQNAAVQKIGFFIILEIFKDFFRTTSLKIGANFRGFLGIGDLIKIC